MEGEYGEECAEELIDASPASRVANPAYQKRARTALPLDRLRALLDPGLYDDPRHWMATVLVAYTGMRAGEVCALGWDAVDLERGTIRVFRAVKDKGTWIGPPKNGKARIVPIPLTLSKMLSEWKLRSKGPWVFGYSKNRLMGYSHWGVAVARAARAWAGQCIPHVVPVYDEGEARAVDNFLKKYRASK